MADKSLTQSGLEHFLLKCKDTFSAKTHTHNYAGSSSAGGVANSAAKLATARNIALMGAVAGNANFDGSGNIVITTTATKGTTAPTQLADGFLYYQYEN